jgi:hypothetical protein
MQEQRLSRLCRPKWFSVKMPPTQIIQELEPMKRKK